MTKPDNRYLTGIKKDNKLMVLDKLKQIKLLLLDVDGVLTDGGIIYNDNNVETKVFNVKDGFGIKLLMKAGVNTAIVTGRTSKTLYHRCNDLGIDQIFDGVDNKTSVLNRILKKTDLTPEKIAFIGDDLPDIPLLKKVGLSIAVADASQTVRDNADMVTSAEGGKGAVREVCEAILKAKGLWEQILESFL